MTITFASVLLFFAVLCLLGDAVGLSVPRVKLFPLGMALWAISLFVSVSH